MGEIAPSAEFLVDLVKATEQSDVEEVDSGGGYELKQVPRCQDVCRVFHALVRIGALDSQQYRRMQ